MTSLYRSFLRVLEKWPIDSTKKGRDLGEHIRICGVEAFRGSDPRDADTCHEIQEILNRIASNKYKEAFYVSKISSASGLSSTECHQLISNEFLQFMKKEDQGMVSGIKDRFFKKED